MNKIKNLSVLFAAAFCMLVTTVNAQISATDSVQQHVKGNRLSVGGYGEVAYSRNFYSDRDRKSVV